MLFNTESAAIRLISDFLNNPQQQDADSSVAPKTTTNLPPLVILLGPTASGKPALSLALARKFNGEIISADILKIPKYDI